MAIAPDLEIIDVAVKAVLSGRAGDQLDLCVVAIRLEALGNPLLAQQIVLGGREIPLGSRQVVCGRLRCLRASDKSGPCRGSGADLAQG